MNEEINKIIDKLDDCIGMYDYLITPIESNLLVLYIKELQQENKQLKERISNIKDIVYNCSQNNYFYKYDGKYLKSEIIEQLTEELEKGEW